MFDEVRITENLVYDKYGVKNIGYVDLGNVLFKFEQSCESGLTENPVPVARYMLVLIVRGIFINVSFPFAQFPTHSLSSDQLFPVVWEAVEKLEAADFKVMAFVCDGASQNRKFFRMHSKDFVYKSINPYAGEPRPIYFFPMPPT